MARIRTIKPDFCSSPSTRRLTREARLFFLLLLTDVDDVGRFVASPKRLAGLLYPHDEDVDAKKVRKWVDECVKAGMVALYEHDETAYGLMVNFEKHQRVSHKSPSRIPPPPLRLVSGIPPEGIRPDQGSGSGSGSGTKSSSVSEEPPPASPSDDDRFEKTLGLLAEDDLLERRLPHVVQRCGDVGDLDAWLRRGVERRRSLNGEDVRVVLEQNPGMTPGECAGVVRHLGAGSPDAPPGAASAARAREADRATAEPCATCGISGGYGFVEAGFDEKGYEAVAACPGCHPKAKAESA